jgi:hypothetical protein
MVGGGQQTGPALDVWGALSLGTLLLGAALTVLACASMARQP